MKNLIIRYIGIILLANGSFHAVLAAYNSEASILTSAGAVPSDSYLAKDKPFGLDFKSTLYGPGLTTKSLFYSPNQFGRASFNGLYSINKLTLKKHFFETLKFKLDLRFSLTFNNSNHYSKYSPFIWETPRMGLELALLEKKPWKINLDITSDLPSFLPEPFAGYQGKQRTLITNPGLGMSVDYKQPYSRWKFKLLFEPRFFIYANNYAADPQFIKAGYSPLSKPQLTLLARPTVTYHINDLIKWTVSLNADYRKQLSSSWNLFDGSLNMSGSKKTWKLHPILLTMGPIFEISSQLKIHPYLATYPLAQQRLNIKTGRTTPLGEATFIGCEISGSFL